MVTTTQRTFRLTNRLAAAINDFERYGAQLALANRECGSLSAQSWLAAFNRDQAANRIANLLAQQTRRARAKMKKS